jgi:lysozyme
MIDAALIKELEEFEGNKSRVYPDSNGYPSIGIGHLLTKDELSSGKIVINGMIVRYADGLTEDEIEALLNQDLKTAEDSIARLVKVPLTQGQYDGLTSWTFNVGGGALAGSTLLKVLNAGAYDQVPDQMRRWVHNKDGSICAGLQRRREAEVALWNGTDADGCSRG